MSLSDQKPKIIKMRAEQFGALIALDAPPAVVAINRKLAKTLGVVGDVLWSEPANENPYVYQGPIEAHLSVTERCGAGCKGCYVDAKPDGFEPQFDVLKERLRKLAELGAFRIAFGGGEALSRKDIYQLGEEARKLGLEPTLTTSGFGLTRHRARELRVFAQVNISHDGVGDSYENVRGFDGVEVAERAIQFLREEGIRVGVNYVLTQQSFSSLMDTVNHVASLGVCEVQLLRFKPTGRGKLDYLAMRLTKEQVIQFPHLVQAIVETKKLGVRIDCSLFPFLASDEISPEAFIQFGVAGCEGGRALVAVKSDGRMSPCSFEEAEGQPDELHQTWQQGDRLRQYRDHSHDAPEPCRSCAYQQSCRGGCRVVTQFLTGDIKAPDPECPRVQAYMQFERL